MADDIVAPAGSETLADWLRRQLDEDQRIAEAAVGHQVSVDVEWGSHAVLRHIHRWSSARVLRDVAAKRLILDLHRPVTFTDATLGIRDAVVCLTCHAHLDEPDDWPDDQEWAYPLVQQAWPCPTVDALAQSYRGEPGWREEWDID